MRSGVIEPTVSGGTLTNVGKIGYNRTSRGTNTRYDGVSVPSAYYMFFDVSSVNASRSNHRYNGFPLRCLSTVLDNIVKITLIVFVDLCYDGNKKCGQN